MKQSYKYVRYIGEHAYDNRFASQEEIQKALSRYDYAAPDLVNGGGVPLMGDQHSCYLDNRDYHTLIMGSTGSMKTRVFVLPAIYSMNLSGENMFITDPKGEIFQRVGGWLKSIGYDVKVFNLRDPLHSDFWNPLYESYRLFRGDVADRDRARGQVADFANLLAYKNTRLDSRGDDEYWKSAPSEFIQGAILSMLVFADRADIVSTRSCSSFLLAADTPTLQEYVNAIKENSPLVPKFYSVLHNAEGTRHCVMSLVSTDLAPFSTSEGITYITSKNNIDMHAISDPAKKTAIFVIVPDEKTTYHFLAASFIKQLYETAISDASKMPSLALPRRLNFILDEFANMPPIPDMPSMISAARSRNVRFVLVVQSYNQLVSNYGPENAETILSNCLDWVFLSTKEQTLIDKLVNFAGKISRDPSSPNLISAPDLMGLKKSRAGCEAMLFLSRSRPYVSFMPDISAYNMPKIPAQYPDTHLQSVDYFDFQKHIMDLFETDEIRARVEKFDSVEAPDLITLDVGEAPETGDIPKNAAAQPRKKKGE